MNYLNEATLEVLLGQRNSSRRALLTRFKKLELLGIFNDLIENNIQDCFTIQVAMDIKSAITIPEETFYNNKKNYALLSKIYNSYLDKMILSVQDVLDIEKDIFHYDDKGFLWVFDIVLKEDKVKIISEFMAGYIQEYEQDKLVSLSNYYSFEKTIANIDHIFNAYYKKYGKRFNINKELDISQPEMHHYLFKEKEARIYELLFYLEKKGFIDINSCKLYLEENNDLPF